MSDLEDAQLAPISSIRTMEPERSPRRYRSRYVIVRSHVGGLWPTWEIESDQLDENLSN